MSRLNALFAFLALPAALPLLNCGGGSPHAPEEIYYLVATNIKLPYWQSAFQGVSRAATQLKVRAEMVGPDTYDPKAQQQEFQRVVRLKPSGILISAADPSLLKADIDAAVEAGIPVITMDSDAPTSKRLLYIGTNNYQAGTMGGKVAAGKMQGKGNVVVFSMPEQDNLNERLQGYRSAFSGHQISIREVINVKGDARIAFDKTTEIAQKSKASIDAFVCLEATACKEVAEVLDRYKITGKTVVAMDTDQQTLEWIQKGVIAATLAQKPFTMAFYGVKMLDDLHHNKPSPLSANWSQDASAPMPTFVDTGTTMIDKNNVDEFLQTRQRMK